VAQVQGCQIYQHSCIHRDPYQVTQQSILVMRTLGVRKQSTKECALPGSVVGAAGRLANRCIFSRVAADRGWPLNCAILAQAATAVSAFPCRQSHVNDSGANLSNWSVRLKSVHTFFRRIRAYTHTFIRHTIRSNRLSKKTAILQYIHDVHIISRS